ncbi:MAG: ribbon-helix-helix protein, CopG family [Magnetococcales bacterium]|nr:ribbon-helix-helix protein, CopG family [Magnetococcales bacterium]MBF0438796.1 ribbon-helix-helix protein, CopG family [Magnetococcales bacterium]
MLTVTIPDDLAESFRLLAEGAGQSLHECIAGVMRRYLDEMEELEDVEDARFALEEYERNGGGVPWDQVKRDLGIG